METTTTPQGALDSPALDRKTPQRHHVRFAITIALLLACVLALVFGPHVVWQLQAPKQLAVVVVDKTVPHVNFREHESIPWLLRAMKVVGPDGRFLDPERDYIGFDPRKHAGTDLTANDLRAADVLYIADTYGVYQGDYERRDERGAPVPALERSERIYGGVTPDEAKAIRGLEARGGLVVAEFNAFASPTGEAVRAEMEDVFGVHATHWIGRYWPDLQDVEQVPRWVGKVYERVHHRPFDFTGGGMVFVRDDADIFVLRDGVELTAEKQRVSRLIDAPEVADVAKETRYLYWMDVLEPVDCDVIYEHRLLVTKDGRARLKEHAVPEAFPAVARRRGLHAAWTFAGDFADASVPRGDAERTGLLTWRRVQARFDMVHEESRFLWGFYAPLFEGVVKSRVRPL